MSKRKNILLEEIEIIDVANKGKSVAKHNGVTIFTKGGVPGDICDINIFKKRKSYWEGNIIETHTYSKKRTKPRCEHFEICGGCTWQNIEYKHQLEYKETQILNNLKRIGKISSFKHNKILPSKQAYFYRNKMEFGFSNKKWITQQEINLNVKINNRNALGLHVSGFYDKVIDLKNCYLQAEPANTIRLQINEFAKKNKLSYYDIKNHQGLLRNLLIRITSIEEIMVLIQFGENNKKNIELIMTYIKESFPEITSLLYIINTKLNDSIFDQKVICYSGRSYIMEKIDELYFKINAKTFFQTNSKQAEILYQKIKGLASFKQNDIVYDLYTGTGTIAQYISKYVKKVIGIDCVEDSINSAIENAEHNKIENCSFYCGNMKNVLTEEFIKKSGNPNILITDPPREGMHKKVVKEIMNIMPQKIIYVSCNSSTQARDIEILSQKYKVVEVQPVDMFPQTYHVENIVVLESK
ncbi:MAG: 23S rRNA (uracil(1939)-C(5))-methyltransferase RlmD [Bacteroidota bacterium]|nr:23S rRNA (uracil(1939)-C(5))-methyltransferase RlmD [Bacteroidota bacterium]